MHSHNSSFTQAHSALCEYVSARVVPPHLNSRASVRSFVSLLCQLFSLLYFLFYTPLPLLAYHPLFVLEVYHKPIIPSRESARFSTSFCTTPPRGATLFSRIFRAVHALARYRYCSRTLISQAVGTKGIHIANATIDSRPNAKPLYDPPLSKIRERAEHACRFVRKVVQAVAFVIFFTSNDSLFADTAHRFNTSQDRKTSNGFE